MYLKHLHVLGSDVREWIKGDAYVQALCILRLLFVNYAESEVHLVGLVKVWRHAHDLREGFFCVLQGAIAIVEDTDTIPKFWLLAVVRTRLHDNRLKKRTLGSVRWYSACW